MVHQLHIYLFIQLPEFFLSRGPAVHELGGDLWVRPEVLEVRKMWKVQPGKAHDNGPRGKRKGRQGRIRGQTSKNRYSHACHYQREMK